MQIHTADHTPAPGTEPLLGMLGTLTDQGEECVLWEELHDWAPGVSTDTIKEEVERTLGGYYNLIWSDSALIFERKPRAA